MRRLDLYGHNVLDIVRLIQRIWKKNEHVLVLLKIPVGTRNDLVIDMRPHFIRGVNGSLLALENPLAIVPRLRQRTWKTHGVQCRVWLRNTDWMRRRKIGLQRKKGGQLLGLDNFRCGVQGRSAAAQKRFRSFFS